MVLYRMGHCCGGKCRFSFWVQWRGTTLLVRFPSMCDGAMLLVFEVGFYGFGCPFDGFLGCLRYFPCPRPECFFGFYIFLSDGVAVGDGGEHGSTDTGV